MLRHLAVTIAFAMGSIAVTAGIRVLYLFDEANAFRSTDVDWLLVGLVTFGSAVVAGLSVDAIRLVAFCMWSARPLPRQQYNHFSKGRLGKL